MLLSNIFALFDNLAQMLMTLFMKLTKYGSPIYPCSHIYG